MIFFERERNEQIYKFSSVGSVPVQRYECQYDRPFSKAFASINLSALVKFKCCCRGFLLNYTTGTEKQN